MEKAGAEQKGGSPGSSLDTPDLRHQIYSLTLLKCYWCREVNETERKERRKKWKALGYAI